MVLCADAVLDGESLIGDPTEGALIVLAAKGGLDIDETRTAYPRVAEVPFDSEYKFMATFHEMTGDGRLACRPLLRQGCAGRADRPRWRRTGTRTARWSRSPTRTGTSALEANDRMAESGQRVMVVAQQDFDPATFNPAAAT